MGTKYITIVKNAENFSTKALAMKVVLFTIWWSALACEKLKLLIFEVLNTLVAWVNEEIGLKSLYYSISKKSQQTKTRNDKNIAFIT